MAKPILRNNSVPATNYQKRRNNRNIICCNEVIELDRVFVTRMIPESGIKMMKGALDVRIWENKMPPSKKEIIERSKGCVGLVSLLSDPIDAELMGCLDDLKVISQYAVGYDNIDVQAATERGIIVTNTPGVLTETTADLTWALIMAASRRIGEAERFVRRGDWKVAWGPQMLLGNDIFGATLGIIGLGRIGEAVARRSEGFEMRVLYTTRSSNERTERVEKELNATRVDLDTLLQESDIISIHVPLTNETRGFIGKREFAMMKKGSIFINTSRGAVVDERALVESLKSGHLGAAGLDVFQNEPIHMDNPLLKLENVVLVPHIGSASFATRSKMSTMVAENVITALKGERPPNIVNPEVLNNE